SERGGARASAAARAPPRARPNLNDVFAQRTPLLASDVSRALNAMTGEQLTEFATTRLAIGSRFQDSIQERIRLASERPAEPLLAGAGGSPGLAAGPALSGPLAGLALTGRPGRAAAVAMQAAGLVLGTPGAEPGSGGWVDGYGIFGKVSGTSGTSDFDTTLWGVSAGVDTRIAERWIAGLAGGYAHSSLDFHDLAGQPDANTAQGAAYA